MTLPRKILLTLVVAFVVYAVIADPVGSAHVTANAWDHLKSSIAAIGVFFQALLNR